MTTFINKNVSCRDFGEYIYERNKNTLPREILLWEELRKPNEYSIKKDIIDYLLLMGRLSHLCDLNEVGTTASAFKVFDNESAKVLSDSGLPYLDTNCYCSDYDLHKFINAILKFLGLHFEKINHIPKSLARTIFFFIAKRKIHSAWTYKNVKWPSVDTYFMTFWQYKEIIDSFSSGYEDINWHYFERYYNFQLFSSIVMEQKKHIKKIDFDLHFSLAGQLPLHERLSLVSNLLLPNANYHDALSDVSATAAV